MYRDIAKTMKIADYKDEQVYVIGVIAEPFVSPGTAHLQIFWYVK